MVSPEELMGEVLCHECKHQIGSLRVGSKFVSLKKPVSQNFGIRKDRFPCREKKISEHGHLLTSTVTFILVSFKLE